MNLDEFMNQNRVRNVYVSEPGWLSLYVRKGTRSVGGMLTERVLDLANIEATVKGKGTFLGLLVRIRKKYPKYTIFVECVLVPRFADYLVKRGFTRVFEEMEGPPSFYLHPEDKLL